MRTLIALLLITGSTAAASQQDDPTRPPSQAEIEAWFGRAAHREARPAHSLQSTLLSPTRRLAMIDGQRLGIGDRIAQARVVEIGPGRVVLERADETIVLEIDTALRTETD